MRKYYKLENSIMVTKPSNKPAIGLMDVTQFIMYPYPHELTFHLYSDYLETRALCQISKEEYNKWIQVYDSLLEDFNKFSCHCKEVLEKSEFSSEKN